MEKEAAGAEQTNPVSETAVPEDEKPNEASSKGATSKHTPPGPQYRTILINSLFLCLFVSGAIAFYFYAFYHRQIAYYFEIAGAKWQRATFYMSVALLSVTLAFGVMSIFTGSVRTKNFTQFINLSSLSLAIGKTTFFDS